MNTVDQRIRRLENLLYHVPVFVCEVTPKGEILWLNRAQPGYEVEDFIGKSIFSVSSVEGTPEIEKNFQTVLAKFGL